ncbi:MAG: hypothetical protein HYV63_00500 [Candidatus Schekmanbacteria bacterium]|nr:hypothetical protein [Candidatus Schekmanbacteria bacterium]
MTTQWTDQRRLRLFERALSFLRREREALSRNLPEAEAAQGTPGADCSRHRGRAEAPRLGYERSGDIATRLQLEIDRVAEQRNALRQRLREGGGPEFSASA